jgi:hypothetical protein
MKSLEYALLRHEAFLWDSPGDHDAVHGAAAIVEMDGTQVRLLQTDSQVVWMRRGGRGATGVNSS